MSSKLKYVIDHNALKPGDITPFYILESLQYETIMGSLAYGVSNDSSDTDLYGFSIPPKNILFPNLQGVIKGFNDNDVESFEQYHRTNIIVQSKQQVYDFSIYNISKYFRLCMDNNPNMIDSLFTPDRCVTYTTNIGKMIRDNRKLFLHKGSYYKFKGYAYSQLNKLRKRSPKGKRAGTVKTYGYDVKYAYHLVRLLDEGKQILMKGDIDLESNREQLKDIRRGTWTIDKIEKWFSDQEALLEELYIKSDLRKYPDKEAIRELLLNCLEEFYGSVDDILIHNNKNDIVDIYDEIINIFRKRGINNNG